MNVEGVCTMSDQHKYSKIDKAYTDEVVNQAPAFLGLIQVKKAH